jgi:hypothetical protein
VALIWFPHRTKLVDASELAFAGAGELFFFKLTRKVAGRTGDCGIEVMVESIRAAIEK